MSRLTRNIIHNLWGEGAGVAAAVLAVGFIYKRLGADALGVIYFIMTLGGLLHASFEMGICSTTVREVAAHLDNDPSYVFGLIRSGSLFYWLVYGLLLVAVWCATPLLVTRWIHLGALEPAAAVRAMRILCVGALLSPLRAFYSSLCCGLQRMELNNGIDAAGVIFQQAGTVAVLIAGAHLAGVVAWLTTSSIVWTIVYAVVVARLFPPRVLVPGWSMPAVRRSLRFSANMAGISALGVTHAEADKAIISKLMPVAELGYYGVAAKLIRRAAALTGSVAEAAFPALSAQVRGDRAGALRQYRRLQDLLCFGMIPLFAGVVFCSVPLFTMIFDRRIALELLLPVTFLTIGQFMNGTLNMPYIFSLAVDRPDIAKRLNLLALLVSLPFTVLLVCYGGLAGAGLSWVIYNVFAYSYGLPRLCRECLEMPVSSWLRHVGRVVALAAASYGSAWFLVSFDRKLDLVPLAAAFCGGSLLYGAGAYLLIGSELRWSLRRAAAVLVWRSQPA